MTAQLTTPSDIKAVAHALEQVYDPELGIDIVSLGLIYHIEVTPERAHVVMTMTFPGCPMSGLIVDMVQQMLEGTFPGRVAVVETVDEPRWHPDMLTPSARAWLGLS